MAREMLGASLRSGADGLREFFRSSIGEPTVVVMVLPDRDGRRETRLVLPLISRRSDGRPTHWAIKIRNQRGHEGVHASFMNPPSRWFVVLILWGRTYAAQDEPNRFAAS
jgi:hypothetical protein